MSDFNAIMKAIEAVEGKLKAFDDQAAGQLKTLGKVGEDTKTAIENLGTEQRTLADRLVQLEQKGFAPPTEKAPDADTWGAQLIKTGGDVLQAFRNKQVKDFGVTIKNTISNVVGNTPDQVRPGIVGGPSRILRLEDLFPRLPCSSDAISYVRENVFTNAAAETTEANALPESSVTTSSITEPVATIGHWLKITRQLAADNAALAAYVNLRLRYGVDLRVDNQLFGGNGVAPNISGLTKSGNFTAHGYTAASLTARFGASYTRFDLIGAIIGDCAANDYPADTILLNPVDWWTMRLAKGSDGQYIMGSPGADIAAVLFGLPVVASNAVTADTVGVGSMQQAGTFYDRQEVEIAMSEHDGTNFQSLLVTLRAHRRCALAMERPAAFRYGDLTPA
jgi:HK97 family phage major capsid protein